MCAPPDFLVQVRMLSRGNLGQAFGNVKYIYWALFTRFGLVGRV